MQYDEIDLSIALRKLNELAYEEGDLGYAYWSKIIRLIKNAAHMQDEINRLTHELESYRSDKGH